jgi:hypothetical protein
MTAGLASIGVPPLPVQLPASQPPRISPCGLAPLAEYPVLRVSSERPRELQHAPSPSRESQRLDAPVGMGNPHVPRPPPQGTLRRYPTPS